MAISLGELFDRHIKPDHQVLCVGTYQGPSHDPSALYASTLVKTGRVWILDSDSGATRKALEKAKATGKLKKPVAIELLRRLENLPLKGRGNPERYVREMAEIKKAGVAMRLPKVRHGTALATEFKDKQFDTLIDAGTFMWASQNTEAINSKPDGLTNDQRLQKIVDEYDRIANKAIVIGHEYRNIQPWGPVLEDIERKFVEKGAKVTRLEVSNRYVIPLPKLLLSGPTAAKKKLELDHIYPYDSALVVEFPARASHRGG